MSPVTAELEVATCVSADRFEQLGFSPELDTFRPPDRQRAALVSIAEEPQSYVTLAVQVGEVGAYASFHAPAPPERWSEDRTGRLLELGAIEVTPGLRGGLVAERLLERSFASGRFDATIVLALIYVWNFDLRRVPLGALGYRRLLERLYGKVGFERFTTDDPEVLASPANALMARIGSEASDDVKAEFDRLRISAQ